MARTKEERYDLALGHMLWAKAKRVKFSDSKRTKRAKLKARWRRVQSTR
jgi:hypothetical protein